MQSELHSFPPCNVSGSVCYEVDAIAELHHLEIEKRLGVHFEDVADEAGEYSYEACVLGFSIRVQITPDWGVGILCRLTMTGDIHAGFWDFDAPRVRFERHIARLIQVYELGRVVPHEEVQRRWPEEQRRREASIDGVDSREEWLDLIEAEEDLKAERKS